MINDRKKLKWQTAFFLPEHKKLLKEVENDYYKSKKPILSENQIEEIEEVLSESLANQKTINVITWKAGFFNQYTGYVTKINPLEKQIMFKSELDSLIKIDFHQITDASNI